MPLTIEPLVVRHALNHAAADDPDAAIDVEHALDVLGGRERASDPVELSRYRPGGVLAANAGADGFGAAVQELGCAVLLAESPIERHRLTSIVRGAVTEEGWHSDGPPDDHAVGWALNDLLILARACRLTRQDDTLTPALEPTPLGHADQRHALSARP